MRIVVALGGNALLRRGERMTAENQRRNVRIAAQALAPLAKGNQFVISHGNGPQVGLLALQAAAYQPMKRNRPQCGEEALPISRGDSPR